MRVSIRELRQHFAARGTKVDVVERGRVVAELRRPAKKSHAGPARPVGRS